ncbi:MAG: tetratricopeptide repeat protein [Syntrophaceae bacterium]|nr:tetratricopeptide repeat protein [Syntrophaceae bacterium]
MADKTQELDLKGPDRFQTLIMNITRYVSENRKQFYIGTAAAVVVVLTVSGWFFYRWQDEKSASALYGQAMSKARGEQVQPADVVKAYQEVVTRHPSSQAAALASFRLGNIHYLLKDYDASLKAYQTFLSHAPARSDLVTLAYTGEGYCHEAKGDFKNALSSFEKAEKSKGGTHFESMTLRNIARTYESLNDPAKALDYYKKALGKSNDPFVESLIKVKIATLG